VTVSQVDILEDVSTRVNIKKRREYIGFHSTTSPSNINIVYLGGEDSSADKNMSISDRSTSLVQNRIPEAGDISTVTGTTFQINVDQFLVTDQFTEETPTQPSVPLFYAHTLAGFNASLSDIDQKTLVTIEFLDHDFQTLAFSEYILETEDATNKGQLYNNIENSYNTRTQAADITMVKYTVKTVSGSGVATVEAFHELINNVPIFRLAEFSDIDPYGVLYPARNAYLLTETATGFTVTMPRSGTYAYKESPDSRIKALYPSSSDITSPWFARITNGRFLTLLPTTPESYQSYEYGIAEFNSQTFDPLPPYRSQSSERAYRISSRLVQVSKNIAYRPDNSLYVNVVINDAYGDVKYAMSNDPSSIGLPYGNTSIQYEDGVASLDELNGILEVTRDIETDDVTYVTYYTEEKQFEFTSVDCNPTNNLSILNQRLVLYINPERSVELDQSLFYLVVDPIGRIQYCSQPDDNSDGLDEATVKMLAEDFDTSGNPTHLMYYDKVSPEEALGSRVSGVNASWINEFSFVDKYTVESQLFNLVSVSGAIRENFVDNPKLLIIADISIGESQRTTGFEDFDVRERGGGIVAASFNNALEEQSEVAWYWDQIQLRPYPATTSLYVEVPQSVLQEHGGRFERPDLVAAVERHMQFGGYPVIDSYGVDPTINWYTAASGSLSVAWPSYGSDRTYNVHYSSALDGEYTQDNDTVIQDVPSGNFHSVSGLNPATNYYIKVEAIDGDESSYGPTVRITTASGLEEE
jgi:hypothetical protein